MPTTTVACNLGGVLSRAALPSASWFAVLDAAQDPSAPREALAGGARIKSLYAGELGAMLDDVAPHLATFDPRGSFSAKWYDRWDANLGILLQTRAAFEDVWRHFRQFLLVRDEAGKRYRFRFYDPRVLRAFLPACTADEARQFFGPVLSFYVADRYAGTVLALSWAANRLQVRDLRAG